MHDQNVPILKPPPPVEPLKPFQTFSDYAASIFAIMCLVGYIVLRAVGAGEDVLLTSLTSLSAGYLFGSMNGRKTGFHQATRDREGGGD